MAENVRERPLGTYSVGVGKGDTGSTGDSGDKGDKGENGSNPTLSIQSTTLASGSSATATIVNIGGVNYLITLGIPEGATGSGEQGDRGPRGFPFTVDATEDPTDTYLTDNVSLGTTDNPYFVLVGTDSRTSYVVNDVDGVPVTVGDLNGHLIMSNGINWIDQGPFTGVKGEDGLDGYTPYVGVNDNWWVNGADTGVSAKGVQGDQGNAGTTGTDGNSVRTFDEDWYTLTDGDKTTEDGGTESPARAGDFLFIT